MENFTTPVDNPEMKPLCTNKTFEVTSQAAELLIPEATEVHAVFAGWSDTLTSAGNTILIAPPAGTVIVILNSKV
jgi:hypothetical protein